MEPKKIPLKEAAKLAKVSPSLVYHYIHKGLLRKPDRIPNPKGRGVLAVYPQTIVQEIERIRHELKSTHSLNQVQLSLAINKEQVIIEDLEKLLRWAKQSKYDDPYFKDTLQNLSGYVFSPSLASTCYLGNS